MRESNDSARRPLRSNDESIHSVAVNLRSSSELRNTQRMRRLRESDNAEPMVTDGDLDVIELEDYNQDGSVR